MEEENNKIKTIKTELLKYTDRGIALAFSGGTDSALLLALLCMMNRESPFRFAAFLMDSVLQPAEETAQAKALAVSLGAPLEIFSQDPLLIEEVRNNRKDRCLHCKREIFSRFRLAAQEHRLETLIDGTNADDLKVFRPGLAALKELGVVSPLADAGMTKAAVRALSKGFSLPTADKPSAPCMATRFEYDAELCERRIKAAAEGERLIKGFVGDKADVRLRVSGDTARIEIAPSFFETICTNAAQISAGLRALGFTRMTLDLEGFRSGSFDKKQK